MQPFAYHVFDGNGNWLAEDERTWTEEYLDAASFTSKQLAQDIGEREAGDRIIYVFGLFH